MYGKVFDTIYDGTLYGHWEAIVTMQQLIVLATPDGIIDMTPQAIAARTSIPFEIISKGLKVLSEPDPYTRTPGEEGRRIVLIDNHRPWGWKLVNHWKYRALRDQEQKRQADRDRISEKRRENNNVATVSQSVANVAHTDSDTDSDTNKTNVGLKPDAAARQRKKDALEILIFLNEKTGRHYRPSDTNVGFICKRLSEGATSEDCKAVIAKKCREWAGDSKMNVYLRPATLFNREKFEQYVGELGSAEPAKVVAL